VVSAYLTKPVVRSRLLREAMGRALLPWTRRRRSSPTHRRSPLRRRGGRGNLIRVLVVEDNS